MVMTEGEESTLARLATGEGTLAYLRPEVLGVFPDLRLLSNDGHHFNLNKCVLAANTGFLGGILSSGEADPDPVANITTDLSKEELGMVANFCVSGILPGLDDKSSVSRAFKQFGINLEDLDLVKEEVTGGRDQHLLYPIKNNWPSNLSNTILNEGEEKPSSSVKAEIPPFKGPVSKQVEEEEDLGYVQVKTEMFNYGGQEYSDDDDDYNQEFIGDDLADMFSEIDSESEYVPLARKKRSNKRTGKASKVSLRKRKRKVASSDAADEQAIKRLRKIREDGDSDSGYDPNKDGIEPKELEGSTDADHESRLRLEFPLVPSDGERNQKFQCEKCHFQSDGFRRFRQHELRHQHSTSTNGLFFFCLSCETGYESQLGYREHKMTEHSMPDEFPCPKCNVRVKKSGTDYLEHLGRVHGISGTTICVQCGYLHPTKSRVAQHQILMGPYHSDSCVQCNLEMPSWKDYNNHIQDCHNNVWKYVCGICPKLFDTKDEQKGHRKFHDGEGKKKEFCDICGQSYARLSKHVRETHSKEEHPCTMCEKVFKSRRFLLRHTANSHERTFTCEQCGKSFGNSRILKNHVINMHTSDDQKPFKCSHCPKGFSVLAHLKDHENIHTDSRPHKCKYCDMSFNSIGAKRGHETVMHEGKGPKSRRNASGPRRNRLPGSKSVAGDGAPKKPQKRYPIKYQDCPCEHCGKIFRTAQVLKNHIINIHTPDDQKPYQCRFCNKGFAVKPHLREHEYIHTNEKPYKCPYCSAAFNCLANKCAHVNTVHLGMKRDKRDKKKKKAKTNSPVKPEVEQPQQQQQLQQLQPNLLPPV